MGTTAAKLKPKLTAVEKLREQRDRVAQELETLDPLACDSGFCRAMGAQAIDTHRAITRAKGDR